MEGVQTTPEPVDDAAGDRTGGSAEVSDAFRVPAALTSAPAKHRRAARLDPARCSVQALARADSPVATAPPAQRWLLVEQPGPWGREALLQSRFDAAVAPRLAARARAENVRLLLVRRPDGRLSDTGSRWAVVDARPARERLTWAVRQNDAELLDAPWDGSVGTAAERPVYLVCAHGGHDACCAL